MIVVHTIAEKSMVQEAITMLRQESVAYITLIMSFNDQDYVVEMYDFGADLCVPNHYEPKVAAAYFIACFRRGRRMPDILRQAEMEGIKEEAKMLFGTLSIDLARSVVCIDGEEIRLTPKEFDLLCVMARRKGMWMTYNTLSELIWNDQPVTNHTIATRIQRLRAKIGAAHIQTQYGTGYRFVSD